MGGPFPLNDIGAFVSSHFANFSGDAAAITRAPVLIVAAAGLDNLKFLGFAIDRRSADNPGMAMSVAIATQWLATIANTKTLSLAHEIQESADGTNFDTAEVIEALTVKETASSSTNFHDVDEHDLDLTGRKRYYRINVTLDLNAGSADVASFSTEAKQGGWTIVPQ